MLDFVTICGAGQMVPTHKPAAIFALMKAWIWETIIQPLIQNAHNPQWSWSKNNL
jgi:hypothetical protein